VLQSEVADWKAELAAVVAEQGALKEDRLVLLDELGQLREELTELKHLSHERVLELHLWPLMKKLLTSSQVGQLAELFGDTQIVRV
jgi:hypothetical protein